MSNTSCTIPVYAFHGSVVRILWPYNQYGIRVLMGSILGHKTRLFVCTIERVPFQFIIRA